MWAVPSHGLVFKTELKRKKEAEKKLSNNIHFPLLSEWEWKMASLSNICHLVYSPWWPNGKKKKTITCVLVRVSTAVRISHDHGVYIGRKVSPKSRLKLCRENINTYRLEDSAWEHILPAFNSDSSVVPGHWQHAARFSLKNHKNKPLYRCRFLDIFASFKAPWTECLLSTSLSVLLTSKFTPEWCFKFCLHHSIVFSIQSSKFFHKILQSHKVNTVKFITETKPLPVPNCVLVSFSATVGEKEERKKPFWWKTTQEKCAYLAYTSRLQSIFDRSYSRSSSHETWRDADCWIAHLAYSLNHSELTFWYTPGPIA